VGQIVWAECLGRNGWDNPLAIPGNMGIEALNVSLKDNTLGEKRPGSATVTLTGDAFTGTNHLAKFVAGQDESAAQLIIVSADATPKILRVTAANAAVNLTLADNIASRPQDVVTAVLNGKLFIAYDSTINRLHVYDPDESTSVVRRVGLATPAAPVVADQGAGTYPAVQRWYRVSYRVKSGSNILRESEMSPVTAFTPNATSASARITKPATISENETHWVVYASADSEDGPFYEIAETVVGTTTFDDSIDVTTYDDGTYPLAPLLDSHHPFPSVKYILSDGVRLFGFGVWETAAGDSLAPVSGRLYFTPARGASDADDDDERVQSTAEQDDFLDLNISGGTADRGLAGPLNGRIFAFQSRGIYMIVPTQSAVSPVKRIVISETLGAVSHHSLVVAEDEQGAPALYFLDPKRGPTRIGLGADIQWVGKDVKDVWETNNLSASTVVAHGHYDPAKKQVKWWIATGASNEPDTMIVYHVALGRAEAVSSDVRAGWAKWTGSLAAARTAVLFPSTLAATRPLTECSYAGNASTALFRQDGTSNQDFGTNYQGYVESKAHTGDVRGRLWALKDAYVSARVQSSTTIGHTVVKNFGDESNPTQTVSLAAPNAGSETRVRPRVVDLPLSHLMSASVRLGDTAAANTTWQLDRYDAITEIHVGAMGNE